MHREGGGLALTLAYATLGIFFCCAFFKGQYPQRLTIDIPETCELNEQENNEISLHKNNKTESFLYLYSS